MLLEQTICMLLYMSVMTRCNNNLCFTIHDMKPLIIKVVKICTRRNTKLIRMSFVFSVEKRERIRGSSHISTTEHSHLLSVPWGSEQKEKERKEGHTGLLEGQRTESTKGKLGLQGKNDTRIRHGGRLQRDSSGREKDEKQPTWSRSSYTTVSHGPRNPSHPTRTIVRKRSWLPYLYNTNNNGFSDRF